MPLIAIIFQHLFWHIYMYVAISCLKLSCIEGCIFSASRRLQVQIMACTADQDAVGYLNDIDEKFGKAMWEKCGQITI